MSLGAGTGGQKENVKHWVEIDYGRGPWAKWKPFLYWVESQGSRGSTTSQYSLCKTVT